MNTTEVAALNHDLQERIFDADLNERYNDTIGRILGRLDLGVRLALAASAIIVAVCGNSLVGPQHPKIWANIALAISLISTTVMPLFKLNKLIPAIESERLRWIQLKNDFKNVWNDAKSDHDWDAALKELKKLRKKETATEKSGGIVPQWAWLIEKCRQEVVKAYTK
jgi:uncharacterized protein (UPF0335 family)